MIVLDFVFALLFALLFSVVLVALLGRRGPGPFAGFLFFLALLFFAIWAGGVWLVPVGPPLWGRSWLTFLLVGLIVVLILGATLPPARRRRSTAATEETIESPEEESVGAAVSAFFWIVLVLCLFFISARYLFWPL